MGSRVRRGMQRTLVMLLAGHIAGEMTRGSDIRQALRPGSTNLDHTLEILDTMGVVVDDRPRAFDLWLAAKLDGFAPAIAADLRAWVKTLRDGGPVRRRVSRGPPASTSTPLARCGSTGRTATTICAS